MECLGNDIQIWLGKLRKGKGRHGFAEDEVDLVRRIAGKKEWKPKSKSVLKLALTLKQPPPLSSQLDTITIISSNSTEPTMSLEKDKSKVHKLSLKGSCLMPIRSS